VTCSAMLTVTDTPMILLMGLTGMVSSRAAVRRNTMCRFSRSHKCRLLKFYIKGRINGEKILQGKWMAENIKFAHGPLMDK